MSSTKKKTSLTPDQAKDAVRAIVAKAAAINCVLTTVEATGRLHGRPMAILNKEGDDPLVALYFAMGVDSDKADELAKNPQVLVSVQDGQAFATFAGTGTVSRDRALIERLWTPNLDAYFTEGKDDGVAAILTVTPTAVDYWTSPGLLGHALEVAKSMLPGQKYDGGDRGRIELR